MHNQPSVAELLRAVKHFIDDSAAPNLSGHAAFHARVASNVLAIVMRDLDTRERADQTEKKSLLKLLGASADTDLASLNTLLCTLIKTGQLDASNSQLRAHLRQTTDAQLAVDQPYYSGRFARSNDTIDAN